MWDDVFTDLIRFDETATSRFDASSVLLMENRVDELIAEGEEALRVLQDAGSTAADGGNGLITVLVIVGVVAVFMLGLVAMRMRKNREQDGDETTDTPLFEDQYAIRDEDIVFAREDDDSYSSVRRAAHAAEGGDGEAEAGTDEEAAPSALGVLSDSETHETEEADGTEEWPGPASEEPVLMAADDEHARSGEEQDADAAAASADEHDLAHAQEDADETTEETGGHENVIPLMKREEPAAPDSDENVLGVLDDSDEERDTGIAHHDEHHVETEEDVRYAFASHHHSPMAFSGIADADGHEPGHDGEEERHIVDSHEDDHASRRSYIAPTVLREDFSRLERQQAERIDILRDEMTRQISALKADQNNRLDIVVDALDRKLSRLSEVRFEAPASDGEGLAPLLNEFTRQVNALHAAIDNQAQRIRAITQILDDRLGTVSHVYGEVRNIGERIDRFTEKLGDMEKSIADNSRLDMMADVQLSDVVRSSLPPDSYEFKPLLSNNHRADCVIRLPHPPGTIVVDTRFPLDAYNALPSRDEASRNTGDARGAEDSFRRAVLRHIIDVAERYIVPGETADSALMFVPTEAIYTTLHSRFPDLIRDSFRARVWIVSPSTLMGTLQTLRGVLRDSRMGEDAARKAQEDEALREEMEALRTRATTLARNFETTQSELRAILDATDRVFTRKPAGTAKSNGNGNGHRREHLVNELYDRKAEWPGSTEQYGPKEQKGGGGATRGSSSLYEEFSRRPDPLR